MHIALKKVCVGVTQPSTKFVRNLPFKQNFRMAKVISVKTLKDISHIRKKYKGMIFLITSVAMTRSDVWDRYPSINRSDYLY